MSNRKVVVFATSFLDTPVATSDLAGRGAQILKELDGKPDGGVSVEYRCDRSPLEPLKPADLEGVTAVIADLEHYNADVLSSAGIGAGGSLELVARYGVGYDAVDLDAATAAGVFVTNTPGANSRPTAEWAFATLLDVAGRRMPHHTRASAGLGKEGPPRLDVSGKTLGIVGTGAIGRNVAELATGFRMTVLACDPYPNEQWATECPAEYVPLDELLLRADFVTLHAASREQIIGPKQLELMRTSSVLVNCARGILVDNRAAFEAVRSGKLFGYGLDEIWTERDLDLAGLNIVVSPHVGSDTDGGKFQMQIMSASAVADYLAGRPLKYLLNPSAADHR